METRVNYTIVGLFVIGLITALIIAGIWIGRRGQTMPYDIYAINMQEAVSGLNLRAPVKFNGVNVGYVYKMSLNADDPRIVQLLLKIQQGTPINSSSTATLMSQGITGISYIGLKTADPKAPAVIVKPDEIYPTIKWAPSVLFELDVALREFNANIKTMTMSVNELLNQQNQKSIQESLANLAKFTGTLAANSKEMDRLVKNSATASAKLPAVLQQMQTTLKTFGIASGTANTTFKEGNVAVQNITQQTLPATLDALNRLNSLLANLQQLTEQMQANPSILVRGKKPAKLGPGE